MMDPNTGEVLALIGGNNYSKSQFNRATKAKRQVGSTMKPLLYYSALESGFTSSSSFTSEKTTFTFSGGKSYSPKTITIDMLKAHYQWKQQLPIQTTYMP